MTAASAADRDVQDPDPERLAAAVRRCPLVSSMAGGRFGEVVSYLPGRQVRGVLVGADAITVSVVGAAECTAASLLEEVCAAVRGEAPGRNVNVVFADLAIDDS